jgi:hypothetical protein
LLADAAFEWGGVEEGEEHVDEEVGVGIGITQMVGNGIEEVVAPFSIQVGCEVLEYILMIHSVNK